MSKIPKTIPAELCSQAYFKFTCLRRNRQIKETGGVLMQAGSKSCIAKLSIALQACPRDKLNVQKQLEQTKNSLQVIPIIVVVYLIKVLLR